jgi:hypothetical protein
VKGIHTPLCETIVVVAQTDERKEGRGNDRDEGNHCHAPEEGPIDKGEPVHARVEHHRPSEHEKERDGKECPGQLAHLTAYGEPALYVLVSALARVIAGCRNVPSLARGSTTFETRISGHQAFNSG